MAIVTAVEPPVENGVRPCDNQGMTKAELHELVDRLAGVALCPTTPMPSCQRPWTSGRSRWMSTREVLASF
jgi:hypothetical protein